MGWDDQSRLGTNSEPEGTNTHICPPPIPIGRDVPILRADSHEGERPSFCSSTELTEAGFEVKFDFRNAFLRHRHLHMVVRRVEVEHCPRCASASSARIVLGSTILVLLSTLKYKTHTHRHYRSFYGNGFMRFHW